MTYGGPRAWARRLRPSGRVLAGGRRSSRPSFLSVSGGQRLTTFASSVPSGGVQLHYARQSSRFVHKNTVDFLLGVMMWSCRSYGRKLYPIGVGVTNDNVDWVSFPSVEAFAVMLSAISMVF
uniref:Uncharacterized protein n=1 Tax=Setaria italica TaxID=4555 RepID=K4A3M7_SETIT